MQLLQLFTANGTGAPNPYDPGQYPVMVANALLPSGEQIFADKLDGLATQTLIDFIPTNYPASIYPMGASVAQGVSAMVANIQGCSVGTPKALAGYSQGAIVTSTVWRDHVLNPSGDCHQYLNDFVAAVNWGNPMRCPGIAHGNTAAGWKVPGGGGIAGTDDLTAAQTPNWWYDYANPNGIVTGYDLYTDSPVGTAAGTDEELIYNCVVTGNFGGTLEGLLAILESLAAQFTAPLSEVIGIATAVWNGLTFVGEGPAAGHYQYDVTPAIAYLRQVAQQVSA